MASFLGFELGSATPDENTIRHFRNRMTETGTLKRVMKAFDWQLHKKGYIQMSAHIVDATLVPAPKPRNTEGEKEAVKAGKTAKEIWPDVQLEGTVVHMSADTIVDEATGASFYRVLISTPPEQIERLDGLEIVPGMLVEAYLRTDERTVLSYLIKSFSSQVGRAYREE